MAKINDGEISDGFINSFIQQIFIEYLLFAKSVVDLGDLAINRKSLAS